MNHRGIRDLQKFAALQSAAGRSPLTCSKEAKLNVDTDGKLDMAFVSQSTNRASVLPGNGDGKFQSRMDFSTGNSPDWIVAGDFNGDDGLDFAFSNLGDHTISVYLSTPVIALYPSSLDFGDQPVGTTSSELIVTLSNASSVPLAISEVGATGDFAQTNDCGLTARAGATCTISITFTPTDLGPRTGTITITDSVPGSPQVITLTGNGR